MKEPWSHLKTLKCTKIHFVERHFLFHISSFWYNFYILSMHMNVDKPQNLYRMRNLQFQPSTTCIKMLPLQNQEPVIAHPCRHLGCRKNCFDGPLQNEKPATTLARGFLYKIRAPNPLSFGTLLWFSEPLASTKWGTWHEQTFKQNGYLEQRKHPKIQRSIL